MSLAEVRPRQSNSQIQAGELFQNSEGHFIGQCNIIGRFTGELDLVPVGSDAKRGEQSPDFNVFLTTQKDGRCHVGAGWIKETKRANSSVPEFVSMSLTHPDWPSDLSLTAFPPDKAKGEKNWRVVWSRPRVAA